MTSRIRIYDRPTGRVLADVLSSANRTWKLNDFGKCNFDLDRESPKAAPEIIKHRNLVYITHDYLPPWGGYLFTPRVSDDVADVVKLSAYGPEKLMNLRRSAGKPSISGAAGDIFVELVRLANKREDLRIRIGDIYSGGKSFNYELGKTGSMYDDIKKLAAMTGCDWSIDPYIEPNGNLAFLANWYDRRGDRQTAILEQGVNFDSSANVLTEQGDLVNDLTVEGNGATENARAEDWISEYGLIEGTESYSSEKTPDTLKTYAEKLVEREARGRNTFRIRAFNKNGLFYTLRLGNEHVAKFPLLGRTALVRTLAIQYPDTSESVDLTVDEVIE